MSQVRWVAESVERDIDRRPLQVCTVYPEGIKKEQVKKEQGWHKRDLLVREGDFYRLAK